MGKTKNVVILPLVSKTAEKKTYTIFLAKTNLSVTLPLNRIPPRNAFFDFSQGRGLKTILILQGSAHLWKDFKKYDQKSSKTNAFNGKVDPFFVQH